MQKKSQLFLVYFLMVAPLLHAQYSGGMNDGYSTGIFCGSDLNGTISPAISLNPLSGSTTPCSNFSENYSISIATGFATIYSWSTPPSSSITGYANSFSTSLITLGLGGTSGNISVVATNGCTSATAFLTVAVASCSNSLGGSNDGYSASSFCGNDLNGTGVTPLTLNPILGPTIFCFNYGETYTVTTATGSATSFLWSGPSGTTLGGFINTSTSSAATINLPSLNGTISVTASNGCNTVTANLGVAGINCFTGLGGANDGFSVATANLALPVTLVDFDAKIISEGVQLSWNTASELDNNFFTIERSFDGVIFSFFTKVDGAGTSSERHNYSATDSSPYSGILYYRLSQTDFDGHNKHLNVVSIDVVNTDEFGMEVYPNPVLDKILNLRFSKNWWSRPAEFEMTDILGNSIIKSSLTIVSEHQIDLRDNNLTTGLYLIIVSFKERKFVKKVILL